MSGSNRRLLGSSELAFAVIEFWLQLPLAVRFAVIATAGVTLGALANWAIYTLCYFPRPISPWTNPSPQAPQRHWSDRIPIVGWFGLRRESAIHGRWFWLRPLLIELGLPFALLWYYVHVAIDFQLFDANLAIGMRSDREWKHVSALWMNQVFWFHTIALALMITATFIDFDEQTVPDWITIPGTLGALSLASIAENVWLPFEFQEASGVPWILPSLMSAPDVWNEKWDSGLGLLLAEMIFSGWCFALADRRIILRRGLRKAAQFFYAGLFRHESWKTLLGIWLVGCLGIFAIYLWGEHHWRNLLTALVGLAIGGTAVWGVRIVAGAAMRQEAMGFGDVTLMAMLGAFVGWQAALLAFALAPMTAVLIVLVQFILTRNRVVAFGPYLCAGTIVTVLFWPVLWHDFGAPAFALGPILPVILISLLLVMGVMLASWRWLKQAVLGVE